ncbi:hypothetical protein O181_025896 [Austropuccinia psidii MF-1]|uniref:Uncharacterized protein n=1 Tax=Austropuccinia psidii MF-1 TaxID=1389203 RepID=A0A9Q3CJH0_9BASI|nr:hypothetical protein [Austropuccinia psidii MF-1]
MPRIFRQEGSPSPFSKPMASSTPFNSQRPNTLPKPKDYNLWFDGKEVEILIKRVENIAEIEGASGRDIARQISFWTKDQEISYHIEGMTGYETNHWEQSKLDMKRRWGTVSPERRYKISSITQLFKEIQQEGGIRNMTQYKTFIGEYESIINYLKRYQYIQGDINHNQEILLSLSSSVQESTYKQMMKDKAMVQDLDGGYIIPRLDIIKLYIKQDLEAKFLIQQKEFSQPNSQEKKARLEEESWEEVLKKMKDLTKTIKNPQPQENQSKDTGNEAVKEVLNQLKHLSEVVESPKKPQPNNNQDHKTIQNSQPFRPIYPSPPISSGYQPYAPAKMAPRQPSKCYYCLEEGHSAIISIQESKGEKETAIAQIEEWGNWKPPQISPANENLQINIGPRQTRKRASRQEIQIQTQQEDKNETHKPFKKKIPGSYHKEYEAEEEIRVLIPTKYKKTQEGKEVDNDDIKLISKNKDKEGPRQELQKMELKDKVKSTANTPKLII